MEDFSRDFYLAGFETYEDYLESFLTIEDFRYLENIKYERLLVDIYHSTSSEVYTQEDFENRKHIAFLESISVKKTIVLRSVGINFEDDDVLSELAKREKANVQKIVSTIIFVTRKSKSGFDISAYIDFEESLRDKDNGLDWAAIFNGKAIITPQQTDLSYYNWRTGKTVNNNSDNYSVVNDRHNGLMFMYKGDRKVICVKSSCKSVVSSKKHGNVIFFDHVIRRKT